MLNNTFSGSKSAVGIVISLRRKLGMLVRLLYNFPQDFCVKIHFYYILDKLTMFTTDKKNAEFNIHRTAHSVGKDIC